MKTLHFKEIDAHMKEYWKTHTIVPPHEDDPLYIVGRIEENLTMNEKPIRIILENYNNEKITFTMSSDAIVESMFEMDPNTMKIEKVYIDAKAYNITIEKEEFIE